MKCSLVQIVMAFVNVGNPLHLTLSVENFNTLVYQPNIFFFEHYCLTELLLRDSYASYCKTLVFMQTFPEIRPKIIKVKAALD